MQQRTEIDIPPVILRKNSAGDKAYVQSIEAEALALQADVSTGSLSKTKAALSRLRLLSGMLGRVGHRSGQVQAMISEAIAQAQHHIDELESEQARIGYIDPDVKFEGAVYVYMSARARQFYHEIDAEAIYAIAPVSDDGEIVSDAAREVNGKTLRHRMSEIKFHSLDTMHKKQVLYKSFGTAAAEGEGTPKNKELLEKKKKELITLHEALDDMEAYKALMISYKYKADIAAKMIERNHEIIAHTHGQIDEVVRKYDTLISDIDNGMAMATLKAAKLKMKKILRGDVIDHVLLEKTSTPQAISGGIGVAEFFFPLSRLRERAGFSGERSETP